jgi:hypothetical protein
MIRMQKEVDAQRVQGRYEEEADRQRRNALKRQRDDSDNAVVVALERKRRQHMLHQNIVRLRENNGAAISGIRCYRLQLACSSVLGSTAQPVDHRRLRTP